MPEAKAYSYAVVRVVPRVERDEFVNAGVLLFCQELRFLSAATAVHDHRILALWPEADLESIHRHVRAIARICAGDPEAGAIARLPQKDRFHWLTAPRSTTIQVSPVRTGLTTDPQATLMCLAKDLVS